MIIGTDIITLLHTGVFSCVVRKGDETRTYTRRGVIDLYELYEKDSEFLCGAMVADKVIGKGAAALIALGQAAYLYADVISSPALALLRRKGIAVEFGQEVPHIINRRKDGRCPLETACDGIDSPEAIYPVIRNFVQKHFPNREKQETK